jgi:hypothetical protein
MCWLTGDQCSQDTRHPQKEEEEEERRRRKMYHSSIY